MNRSQSLAAALAVACLATGGATASAAAPLRATPLLDDLLPLPLDLAQVERRLLSLGLNADQIVDITTFLTKDRGEQSEALRAAGLIDPGGDLSDSNVVDFLLGQYVLKQGGDRASGITLQLSSGKADPRVAIELGQTLKPTDIKVTDTEVAQQQLAFGSELNKDTAALRARLQRTATLLRPYLAKLLPGLAAVWIEDKDEDGKPLPAPHLVVSTAGAVDDVVKVLGAESFAGIPIETRRVKFSRTTLNSLAATVRAEVGENNVLVSTDPATSVVKIQASDAATDKRVRAAEKVAKRVRAGEVVVVAPKKTGPSAVVGGHATQYGQCTWGFSAQLSGNKMLATAAHCTGESGYGLWVPTNFVEEKLQGAVDTARHTTDPGFYPQFDNFVERAGLPDLEITSRTGWSQTDFSDIVCHQGRVSGHSCGWVTSTWVAPWWVPYSGFFVQVEGPTLNEFPGDSGGPWFYGNSAYGIHTGGSHSYGSSEIWGVGVFGAIDFAETDVHFTVLTK